MTAGLVLFALAPLAALLVVLIAPFLIAPAADRSKLGRRSRSVNALLLALRRSLLRLRDGLRVFRHCARPPSPRPASSGRGRCNGSHAGCF